MVRKEFLRKKAKEKLTNKVKKMIKKKQWEEIFNAAENLIEKEATPPSVVELARSRSAQFQVNTH